MNSSQNIDKEELNSLIKAIKFAHSEYGDKSVLKEIHLHGGKWTNISLNQIRKYTKKLGLRCSNKENTNSNDKDSITLMTIGGKSKSIITNDIQSLDTKNIECSNNLLMNKQYWMPIKLDVPMLNDQEYPYNAVICHNHSKNGDSNGKFGEIFKIQVAMTEDKNDLVEHPMLLYNKDKTKKTFIHSMNPAYNKIKDLIIKGGKKGTIGGQKAYFWGKFDISQNLLFLYVNELSPFQEW